MSFTSQDYYYYKLYEWGVFVPTVVRQLPYMLQCMLHKHNAVTDCFFFEQNQRETVTEAFTNTSDVDTLYSTLGEVCFSKFMFPNHVSVKKHSMDVCCI